MARTDGLITPLAKDERAKSITSYTLSYGGRQEVLRRLNNRRNVPAFAELSAGRDGRGRAGQQVGDRGLGKEGRRGQGVARESQPFLPSPAYTNAVSLVDLECLTPRTVVICIRPPAAGTHRRP